MYQACRLQIAASIVLCFLLQVQGAADKYTNENRPYEFGFKIDGQQHRHEKKDKDGIIMGEFGFITADDVYHVTVYVTDEDGHFKILSMKNIHLKSAAATPSRQGYSRALEPSPEAPPELQNQPPQIQSTQPQLPVTPPLRKTFETVSLEPPIRSCSSCSIPTTSTQPPPSPPSPYNKNNYKSPPLPQQNPNQQDFPVSPSQQNSPQFSTGNDQSYPQSPQDAKPNYPAAEPNYPGKQQNYPNDQPPGFTSQGTGALNPYAQHESELNYSQPEALKPENNDKNYPLGKVEPNLSRPTQAGLLERQPKQFNFPQKFNTNTGFASQGPNIPQGQNYPQAQNPQGQNYPLAQNYRQEQRNPQVKNYPQGHNYPPGQNYPEVPNYLLESNYPQAQQGPNYSQGSPPSKPTLLSAQMQIVDKNTDIYQLNPGEKEGLPPGLAKHDMVRLLYTFNYTLAFQGHYEEGYSNGVKKGYYFVTGRDGMKKRIDYVADDTGFHPKVSSEVLDILSEDVPKPETEKDAKYGLRGYEFKWLYYPADS